MTASAGLAEYAHGQPGSVKWVTEIVMPSWLQTQGPGTPPKAAGNISSQGSRAEGFGMAVSGGTSDHSGVRPGHVAGPGQHGPAVQPHTGCGQGRPPPRRRPRPRPPAPPPPPPCPRPPPRPRPPAAP